ncbi:hypothetical protein GJ496_007878 [Pomphorhynchus laevis]|nr:hypothetical protein GJ496_007878 [Pomphorhynchus laevis]
MSKRRKASTTTDDEIVGKSLNVEVPTLMKQSTLTSRRYKKPKKCNKLDTRKPHVEIIDTNEMSTTITSLVVKAGRRAKIKDKPPRTLKEAIEPKNFSKTNSALIIFRHCVLCHRWKEALQCLRAANKIFRNWKSVFFSLMQLTPKLKLIQPDFDYTDMIINLLSLNIRHADVFKLIYNLCSFLMQDDPSLQSIQILLNNEDVSQRLSSRSIQYTNTTGGFLMDTVHFAIEFLNWKSNGELFDTLKESFDQIMNNDKRSHIMDSFVVAFIMYLESISDIEGIKSILLKYVQNDRRHSNAWLYLYMFQKQYCQDDSSLSSLKTFVKLQPQHKLVLTAAKICSDDSINAIGMLMEFLDYTENQNNKSAWKLLYRLLNTVIINDTHLRNNDFLQLINFRSYYWNYVHFQLDN